MRASSVPKIQRMWWYLRGSGRRAEESPTFYHNLFPVVFIWRGSKEVDAATFGTSATPKKQLCSMIGGA